MAPPSAQHPRPPLCRKVCCRFPLLYSGARTPLPPHAYIAQRRRSEAFHFIHFYDLTLPFNLIQVQLRPVVYFKQYYAYFQDLVWSQLRSGSGVKAWILVHISVYFSV